MNEPPSFTRMSWPVDALGVAESERIAAGTAIPHATAGLHNVWGFQPMES
jgi:hypothetical protein